MYLYFSCPSTFKKMYNDASSTCLSHGGPKSVASDRSSCCHINDFGSGHLISFSIHHLDSSGDNTSSPNYIPMMARHCSGRDLSRSPYSPRTKRPSLWDGSIYYLGSVFLLRFLLGLLSLKSCSYSGAGRLLTPYGDHCVGPI